MFHECPPAERTAAALGGEDNSMRMIGGKTEPSRRDLLRAAGPALLGLGIARLGLAATLPATPAQTAGPFYPKTLPLDSDNDLVRVTGHAKQASGVVTHVLGRVLDVTGKPLSNARLEIWQCDSRGHYHYVDDRPSPLLDADFQGYGRTISAEDGSYRFRTIRPVRYPGRTPHIHFAVAAPSGGHLITQMYVAGEPLNENDPVLAQIRDPTERARVIVPLTPAPQIETDALVAAFDIVVGRA